MDKDEKQEAALSALARRRRIVHFWLRLLLYHRLKYGTNTESKRLHCCYNGTDVLTRVLLLLLLSSASAY
jgi:hypothetical protein